MNLHIYNFLNYWEQLKSRHSRNEGIATQDGHENENGPVQIACSIDILDYASPRMFHHIMSVIT